MYGILNMHEHLQCNVALGFGSVGEVLKCDHSSEYFPVVLAIMLYKVVLTVESVDEILKCDNSNESY